MTWDTTAEQSEKEAGSSRMTGRAAFGPLVRQALKSNRPILHHCEFLLCWIVTSIAVQHQR